MWLPAVLHTRRDQNKKSLTARVIRHRNTLQKEQLWNFLFERDFWSRMVIFFSVAWKQEDDLCDLFKISFNPMIPY